ncbi:MAG: YfiR family protein [Saprospiraceae bacterium]
MNHLSYHIIPNRKRLINKFYQSLFFIFLMSGGLRAQPTVPPEFRVKAVFVYNFTQFIDWPKDAFEFDEEPLIIGVLGDNPFGTNLEEAVKGERVGTHPIQVRYFKDIADLSKCHILYINLNQPDAVKRAINSLAGHSTLTIQDMEEFPQWGGMIRFFINESKINLVINTTAAKAAKLRISSKLLKVAKIY